MKFRGTLLLLVLASGLLAYIWLVEKDRPTIREAADRQGLVFDIDRDDIDTIRIQNAESVIELKRSGADWQMTKPVSDNADGLAVSQLLTTLEMLRSTTEIDPDAPNVDKKLVRESGVDSATLQVTLEGKKVQEKLQIGKESANEGKLYARVAGKKSIYVIPADIKSQLTKRPDEFRDHRLMTIQPTSLNKVAIRSANGEIELDRDGEHWRIIKPLKARGNDAVINDLLAQTLNTRADAFLPTNDPTASAALAQPLGTLVLGQEGESNPVEMKVSKPSSEKSGKSYVKLSNRDTILQSPASVATILEKSPNDLRDRHIAQFDFNTIDKITVSSAGKPTVILRRKDEAWSIESAADKPANPAVIQRLGETLASQDVTGFVSDVASDLAKYGLDKPRLRVTLSSIASENTAESNAGEESVVDLLFGRSENGNVFAKLGDEPFIFSVSESVYNSVPTEPLDYRSLAIFNFKPDDLIKIEIARQSGQQVTMERVSGEWKIEGAEVSSESAQSLVNTLAHLRAERWVGDVKPEQVVAKPSLVVRFASKDSKSHEVKIGEANRDGFHYATSDVADGVFLISAPDFSALSASMIKPAASPTAAPSVENSVPEASPRTPKDPGDAAPNESID